MSRKTLHPVVASVSLGQPAVVILQLYEKFEIIPAPQRDPLTLRHRMQFTIELANEIFRNSYAIANNVDTSLTELEVLFPIVPVGYVTFFVFSILKANILNPLLVVVTLWKPSKSGQFLSDPGDRRGFAEFAILVTLPISTPRAQNSRSVQRHPGLCRPPHPGLGRAAAGSIYLIVMSFSPTFTFFLRFIGLAARLPLPARRPRPGRPPPLLSRPSLR